MIIGLQRMLYRLYVSYRPHKRRTVRVAFPLVFVSVLLLGAQAIHTPESSYLILESSATTVKEGEQFTLEVFVYAHRPVNAIDIALAFPEDQMMVRNIDAGQSVITLWTRDPYTENSTVYLQGGTYRQGFSGRHFIARIDAIALQSGVGNIVAENVRLLAGDGSGSEVGIAENDSSVRIRIANESGELVGSVDVVKILTDIDGDGAVDMTDILRFMEAWTTKETVYDFSGDGQMTFRDFAIILADSFRR